MERADEFVFMENVVSGRLVNDTFRVSAAGVAILGNRFRFVDRRSFLDVRRRLHSPFESCFFLMTCC